MAGVYFQFPTPPIDDSDSKLHATNKTSSSPTKAATNNAPRRKDLNTPQALAYRVRKATSKLDNGGPNSGEHMHIAPPLDFSFYSIGSFKDIDLGWDYPPRENVKKVKRSEDGRFESTALKLNNNLVQEWDGFDGLVQLLLKTPEELSWIDISFNYILTVDEILLKYPKLTILYLHGNGIEKLSEVDKLSKLKNLRNLTLHGNPIEEESGYRQYVLAKVPQLKTLDFSSVTKADRVMAPKLVARNGYGDQAAGKKKNRTESF
ncbi:leucine-rich repeat-containing protein 51-like [Amphiura filiformis]|uniref:leucine-rich repeat-containing protein 51-like n=1 Tax=Amphiura filiformis TaxID=82378 RepID=UPI003B222FED